MSERHELFDELEAFDPNWQRTYRTMEQAVEAARKVTPYIQKMMVDFIHNTPEGRRYITAIKSVPDIKGAIEAAQKAEEESPFFQRAMKRMGISDA